MIDRRSLIQKVGVGLLTLPLMACYQIPAAKAERSPEDIMKDVSANFRTSIQKVMYEPNDYVTRQNLINDVDGFMKQFDDPSILGHRTIVLSHDENSNDLDAKLIVTFRGGEERCVSVQVTHNGISFWSLTIDEAMKCVQ